MKTEGKVLLFIGAFFAVTGIVYWTLTYYTTGWEPSGTLMLFGAMLLGLFPASYYLWWSWQHKWGGRMKTRPEDDPEATHEGSVGVVAVFPSSSIWPFFIGFAATLVCLGLVFGIWTATVGIPLAVIAVIGVVRESRRGETL